MSQTVELKVGMSCQGCVGAVKRVLEKMEGVESFDIDKENQKVAVKGSVEPETVLQTVSKTGKKTSFWEPVQAQAAESAPPKTPQTAAAPAQETEPASAQAPEPAQPPVPEAEPKPTEAVSAVA